MVHFFLSAMIFSSLVLLNGSNLGFGQSFPSPPIYEGCGSTPGECSQTSDNSTDQEIESRRTCLNTRKVNLESYRTCLNANSTKLSEYIEDLESSVNKLKSDYVDPARKELSVVNSIKTQKASSTGLNSDIGLAEANQLFATENSNAVANKTSQKESQISHFESSVGGLPRTASGDFVFDCNSTIVATPSSKISQLNDSITSEVFDPNENSSTAVFDRFVSQSGAYGVLKNAHCSQVRLNDEISTIKTKISDNERILAEDKSELEGLSQQVAQIESFVSLDFEASFRQSKDLIEAISSPECFVHKRTYKEIYKKLNIKSALVSGEPIYLPITDVEDIDPSEPTIVGLGSMQVHTLALSVWKIENTKMEPLDVKVFYEKEVLKKRKGKHSKKKTSFKRVNIGSYRVYPGSMTIFSTSAEITKVFVKYGRNKTIHAENADSEFSSPVTEIPFLTGIHRLLKDNEVAYKSYNSSPDDGMYELNFIGRWHGNKSVFRIVNNSDTSQEFTLGQGDPVHWHKNHKKSKWKKILKYFYTHNILSSSKNRRYLKQFFLPPFTEAYVSVGNRSRDDFKLKVDGQTIDQVDFERRRYDSDHRLAYPSALLSHSDLLARNGMTVKKCVNSPVKKESDTKFEVTHIGTFRLDKRQKYPKRLYMVSSKSIFSGQLKIEIKDVRKRMNEIVFSADIPALSNFYILLPEFSSEKSRLNRSYIFSLFNEMVEPNNPNSEGFDYVEFDEIPELDDVAYEHKLLSKELSMNKIHMERVWEEGSGSIATSLFESSKRGKNVLKLTNFGNVDDLMEITLRGKKTFFQLLPSKTSLYLEVSRKDRNLTIFSSLKSQKLEIPPVNDYVFEKVVFQN